MRSRRPAVGLDEPRSDDTGRRLGLECLHEEVHGGRVEKAVAVQDEQRVLARVPGARVHGRREAAPLRGHDARARRRSLVLAAVGRAVVDDDHLRRAGRERGGDAAADEAGAVLVRHDRGYALVHGAATSFTASRWNASRGTLRTTGCVRSEASDQARSGRKRIEASSPRSTRSPWMPVTR